MTQLSVKYQHANLAQLKGALVDFQEWVFGKGFGMLESGMVINRIIPKHDEENVSVEKEDSQNVYYISNEIVFLKQLISQIEAKWC